MTKKLLSVLLALAILLCLAPTAALAAEGDIEINATNFPDSTFRTYVKENFDTDGNDILSTSELAAVTEIYCSNQGISDLTGIEYFTNLTVLHCSHNQLTLLDISKNTNLTELLCQMNQLTSLDVSNCVNLKNLRCENNQLTSLDVSKNTGLKDLMCYENQLTSLDIGENTSLTRLNCNDNQLTSLDVSGCAKLAALYCHDNQLTSLDVSDCTNLRFMDCYNNQLTSLDVSECVWLQILDCSNNRLTLLGVSKNTALKALKCSNNQLTSLDLSVYRAGIFLISDDNSYAITATNGVFDLSTLPGSFDVSRVSNWVGATEANGKLTITDPSKVTYTYDCRNGQSATFTLTVTHMHNHAWSADWSSDETAHWHDCTAAWCPITDNSEKDGYAEHSGGEATCKDRAICDDCKTAYGALEPHNHTNLQHFPAKEATKDAEGNIEYWYCDGCDRYYSDMDGTMEIQKSDTVIEKPEDDSSCNLIRRIVLMLVNIIIAIIIKLVIAIKNFCG